MHDLERTKILVVSFGGQVSKRPSSRCASRTGSGRNSPAPNCDRYETNDLYCGLRNDVTPPQSLVTGLEVEPRGKVPPVFELEVHVPQGDSLHTSHRSPRGRPTSSHLWIPGSPPVSKPNSPRMAILNAHSQLNGFESYDDDGPRLLPDESWIAVLCDLQQGNQEEELPEGFYAAPKDVYMPDLMAVGDVLLGKLVSVVDGWM